MSSMQEITPVKLLIPESEQSSPYPSDFPAELSPVSRRLQLQHQSANQTETTIIKSPTRDGRTLERKNSGSTRVIAPMVPPTPTAATFDSLTRSSSHSTVAQAIAPVQPRTYSRPVTTHPLQPVGTSGGILSSARLTAIQQLKREQRIVKVEILPTTRKFEEEKSTATAKAKVKDKPKERPKPPPVALPDSSPIDPPPPASPLPTHAPALNAWRTPDTGDHTSLQHHTQQQHDTHRAQAPAKKVVVNVPTAGTYTPSPSISPAHHSPSVSTASISSNSHSVSSSTHARRAHPVEKDKTNTITNIAVVSVKEPLSQAKPPVVESVPNSQSFHIVSVSLKPQTKAQQQNNNNRNSNAKASTAQNQNTPNSNAKASTSQSKSAVASNDIISPPSFSSPSAAASNSNSKQRRQSGGPTANNAPKYGILEHSPIDLSTAHYRTASQPDLSHMSKFVISKIDSTQPPAKNAASPSPARPTNTSSTTPVGNTTSPSPARHARRNSWSPLSTRQALNLSRTLQTSLQTNVALLQQSADFHNVVDQQLEMERQRQSQKIEAMMAKVNSELEKQLRDGELTLDPATSKPLISVSLQSSGHTSSSSSRRQPRKRRESLAEDDDDPSIPIALRRRKAIQWLLLTIEKREEPLYCPSWFTAVDPAAVVHLSDVRQFYLQLVHTFSLREQNRNSVDEIDKTWMKEKDRVRRLSKDNYLRFLKGEKFVSLSIDAFMKHMQTLTNNLYISSLAHKQQQVAPADQMDVVSPAMQAPSPSSSSPPSLTSPATAQRVIAKMLTNVNATLTKSAHASPIISPAHSAHSSISSQAQTPSSISSDHSHLVSPVHGALSPDHVSFLMNQTTNVTSPQQMQQFAVNNNTGLRHLITQLNSSFSTSMPLTPTRSFYHPSLNHTHNRSASFNFSLPARIKIRSDDQEEQNEELNRTHTTYASHSPHDSLDASFLLTGLDVDHQFSQYKPALNTLIKLLHSSHVLIKHGRRGKPHLTHIAIYKHSLYWNWKPHKAKAKTHRKIAIAEILQVIEGLSSSLGISQSTSSLLQPYCFCIVSANRELNLQVQVLAERDQWLEGLRALVVLEQHRSSSNRSVNLSSHRPTFSLNNTTIRTADLNNFTIPIEEEENVSAQSVNH